jgi:hypothetical protein
MTECPFDEHKWLKHKNMRGGYLWFCDKCGVSTALTPEHRTFITANPKQFPVIREDKNEQTS